jgi:aspartyl aminopeptidase
MDNRKNITAQMLEFIEKSPSSYHAVQNMAQMLLDAGYEELKETAAWSVKSGGRYFVIRNGSSIIAVNIPEQKHLKGFHIIASHSDSPTFKIKEAPEMSVDDKYIKLNTEKYGGMIMSTWFDRPLSVAGRIAVADEEAENGVAVRLVNIDRDLCVIPNVAIHMNRDINKGVEYNPQTDMLPLFAEKNTDVNDEMNNAINNSETNPKKDAGRKSESIFTSLIAEEAGVKPESILGHDLYLYVRDNGRIIGKSGEYVMSPKLDDLQCAFTSIKAFTESTPCDYVNICAVFDNEEVGSCTRQGADSTFLQDVMERMAENMDFNRNEFLAMVAGSFLISADNAHAVHPNHTEKADPVNKPKLNGGIVIKFHGSQKYTTDAVSAAVMKKLCQSAGVPYQIYTNRSDIAGGSTLGNISTAHVSVSSVDIGLPQLAMHSAVETAGSRDTEYAQKAFMEFYNK